MRDGGALRPRNRGWQLRLQPTVSTTCSGGAGVAVTGRSPTVPVATLALALGSVWVFWGSTLAAMRLAIATIPPLAMVSVRFIVAGALVWAFLAVRGRARPQAGDWTRACVSGATLLVTGNALTTWCVQYVPTGLASLLLSLSPVWMAAFDFMFTRARPTRLAVGGMALGLAGMALLLQPRAIGPVPIGPTLLLIAASISWGFGSIYQRRNAGTNLVLATAMQMVVGGALVGVLALGLGEWRSFDVHRITLASFGGLAWLIVFGSLFAYSAYLWTMRNAPTALASTYAYVNPLVALVLGVVLFHERLTPLAAVASGVILSGVALMMLPAKPAAPAMRRV